MVPGSVAKGGGEAELKRSDEIGDIRFGVEADPTLVIMPRAGGRGGGSGGSAGSD